MCSVKKVFLEILQNSQENTCASLFLIELQALGLFVNKIFGDWRWNWKKVFNF